MSGDMEEEQGPMDVYKYSPAQVVDGKSNLSYLRSREGSL